MKPHLFLNNPRGERKEFNVNRKIDEEQEKDDHQQKPPEAYRPQKNALLVNLHQFDRDRQLRQERRVLDIPAHIDYIQVNFFPVFSNTEKYKTRDRFLKEFGLTAVSYFNLNQSVLLAISDESKFSGFKALLKEFIESDDSQQPDGKRYNIVTLIESFSFLQLINRMGRNEKGDVILGLIVPDQSIGDRYSTIFTLLLERLTSGAGSDQAIQFSTDFQSSIEIKDISSELLTEILDNYDIIQSVQSLRSPVIRSNAFNQPELTWNLTISPPENRDVIVGILDNGVRRITPLQDIIVDRRIDVTNKQRPNPLLAEHPHGTMVATLAALGKRFFDTTQQDFVADAMIMPLKILTFATGSLNIYGVKEAIESAIKAGVKIFNLSVCGPSKAYNEMQSEYAYLLDKLAYDNDILIFIATGNLAEGDVEAMQKTVPSTSAETHFHTYPNHFYNPNELSADHACEATNICIPAESLNNISVGAIADNLVESPASGLTPFKELPAYYTRKWHLDYTRKINGRIIARKQTNVRIRKPDIVMAGGDLLSDNARMHVVGLGDNGTDFYLKEAGTSLAAPLAANLAARIVRQYPDLSMQSVKSLIINSAEQLLGSDFLNDLVMKVQNDIATDFFGKPFSGLTRAELLTISPYLSSEKLYDRIVGYGQPVENKALFSDTKRVNIVIQDTITLNSHKVVKLKIPDYLLNYKKNGKLLTIKSTLCYSFPPVHNNQLGYNPLHISFNIFRDIKQNNPGETAKVIADKKDPWYTTFVQGIVDDKKRAEAKNRALAIKTNAEPWSEDFYPTSSKPFSNTQQFAMNISKAEIAKSSNEISIAIRCTHKRELPPYVEASLRRKSHDFSIVVELSEKSSEELSRFDLYNELIAINELDLHPAAQLEIDGGDLEL
ncbi:MAG: S8 family serine peptidase [Chitinophagaceae bacterium]